MAARSSKSGNLGGLLSSFLICDESRMPDSFAVESDIGVVGIVLA